MAHHSIVQSFTDANETLGNRSRRKLENNTYLERRNGHSIAVRLHATDVVTYHRNGDVILDSGGWRTVTTKDRLNKYAPITRVYSDRGIWYVARNGDWDNATPYADGLTLHADGSCTGAGDDPREELRLRAKVQKYAAAFVTALRAGEVPAPSAGDCWFCAMREAKTGAPLGEVTRDREHLLAHIAENYFVPSLLTRALEQRSSAVMRWTVGGLWGISEPFDCGGDYVWTEIRRSLARYILAQLGMAR